jgi:zinc protease
VETSETLLNFAGVAANRIRQGIEELRDPKAFRAFTLANAAMARQARRRVALPQGKRPEDVDEPKWYPFQLAFRAALGDSGYGLPTGGLESSIPTFTRERVAAKWGSLATARATIVAVGDEEPERLADLVAESLPGLVDRALPRTNGSLAPARWLVTEARPVVQERKKQQSAFAMLFPGPARRDPAHTAAEVWSAVASGLGGRLFEALRERRSLAYTVMGTSWARVRAGALGAYIATSPAREEEARAEMLKELARFAAEPPSADELARAKEYLAGQSEISRMTASAVAGEVAEAWLQGEGLEELEAPWEKYRAITAEQVLAVARASFDPSRMAEGVVRGAAG